ncbi:uncharacterized protein LOC132561807 [Ylistrum balloti]|uniref:uncharacterized protein LOC132561807 n=1 Tax=Ylistrum balloti TaxID=509963 RepID=UPI002905C8E4|nr:uncharacterized protein LOC132561807 [Ylistrum balloti]
MTYCTRLRKLGQNCEFSKIEEEIKSQIIQSCSSTGLRRHILRDDEVSLENILKLACALELSDEHTKDIEEKPEQIHAINRGHGRQKEIKNTIRKQGYINKRNRHTDARDKEKNTKCYRCGGSYPHQGQCPAKGKKCNFCQKMNNFGKVCKSKKKGSINRVETSVNINTGKESDSDSDDAYIFYVNSRG